MPRAVPIDPAKLIEAGRGFATHHGGQGRPRPVWLRQAVSCAYYALFHALCRDAARHLLPGGTPQQTLPLTRAFGHREMKRACEQVSGSTGESRVHRYVRPLVRALKPTPLVDVASVFCDLQEARHAATYDHLAPFSKAEALASLDAAEKAIGALAIADDRDRTAFLALLAIGARLQ